MEKIIAFFNAIKAGDVDKVNSLLGTRPELAQATDDQGISAILTAVYYGQQPIVKELVEYKKELNIWEAAATGQVEKLDQILSKDGSLLNAYAPDGFTPLALAAFFGQKTVLEDLISSGAEVNQASTNDMQVKPLQSAAAHHNPLVARQMIEILLKHGAEVNAVQSGGWTALHEAASRGDVEMVKLLKRYGADLNIKSDDGKTAKQVALEKGHENILTLL